MTGHLHEADPQFSWTFNDWMRSVGAESYAEIARVASLDLGLQNPTARTLAGYEEKRIWEWAQTEIKDYLVALDMIKTLRCIAFKNSKPIFNDGNLALHCRYFVKSTGKLEWDIPNVEQLASIAQVRCGNKSRVNTLPEKHDLFDLIPRVRPPAPSTLYGRDNDREDVLRSLATSPVTLITSVAGNGKTALAWHCCVDAYKERLVTGIDWTTDKRQVMDARGNIYIHEDRPLDQQEIITSMAYRFRWDDVISMPKSQQEGACAEKLRKGRYLIVVDNLETMDDQKLVVDMLLGMMTPYGKREPLSSRALITSRMGDASSGVSLIELDGITPVGADKYINALKKAWQIDTVIDNLLLAKATHGNPLFIQMALQRIKSGSTVIEVADNLVTGADFEAFRILFAPLVKQLSPAVQELAIFAASRTRLNRTGIVSATELYDFYLAYKEANGELPASSQSYPIFMHDIQILVDKRMINVVNEAQQGTFYTFHPLIRAYFLEKYHISDNNE
ncbi:MAG: hypothetical protein AAF846_25355 [Chloroflexota bacterium]